MTEFQFYFNKLAEESVEIAKIALKIAQFGKIGIDDKDIYDNIEICHSEINDFLSVIKELNNRYEFNFTPSGQLPRTEVQGL